jgi:UDP-3-O-[3-hydroxymyristoyl] N-acetylglucosamine deacetylase
MLKQTVDQPKQPCSRAGYSSRQRLESNGSSASAPPHKRALLSRLFLQEANLEYQHTIAAPISFSGVGLHSGALVNLSVLPAPSDTGVVFERIDLDNFRIPATVKNVAHVAYATTLMKRGVLISTIEHLLSSLYSFGIDNAVVEIDNLEVPILDGSALEFVDAIRKAGLRQQSARRTFLVVRRELHLEERGKTISVYPADSLQISYSIDFSHPMIGRQAFQFEASVENFANDIAPARTFGFLHEVEELKKNGLVRGGSLDNAIVLTQSGILNDVLRFKDEFVRHKILDSIGDLSLVGRPLVGRIVANKAGHALHTLLVSRILSDPSNFELMAYGEWKASQPVVAAHACASS